MTTLPPHREPDAQWTPEPEAVYLVKDVEAYGAAAAMDSEGITTAARIDLVVCHPNTLDEAFLIHLVVHPDDVPDLMRMIRRADNFARGHR